MFLCPAQVGRAWDRLLNQLQVMMMIERFMGMIIVRLTMIKRLMKMIKRLMKMNKRLMKMNKRLMTMIVGRFRMGIIVR